MVLSVPSKTFLIGEYGVLRGGPALLVNTEPRFELRVRAGLSGINPFHVDSPAGKLYNLNSSRLKNFVFEFYDPHHGRGGLGASSAQFALLYAFVTQALKKPEKNEPVDENMRMLEVYKNVSARTEGLPPSGYDVLAQKVGGVSLIDMSRKVAEPLEWAFSDLSFLLLRTGQKVATHKHLTHLSTLDAGYISKITEFAIQKYVSANSDGFLESIALFRKALQEQNLTAKETVQMLESLDKNTKVIAAKGCGALGADIVIVFCEKSEKHALALELRQKYEIVGDESLIQEGLKVKDAESTHLESFAHDGMLQ